jgi:hypothetical protein
MSQSTATLPTGGAASLRSRWTGGVVTAVAIGTLLALFALTLLGAAGTALWVDRTQRDGGYVTTDGHELASSGSAIATEETELGTAGVGWLYGPGLLGKVRIRVTPRSPGSRLFVGIGRSADVDRYLAGVGRTVVSEFFKDKVNRVDGGNARSAPGTRSFWVASATGTGSQTILWKPHDGSWKVVVMNADARPVLDVEADLGARFAALPWIALGVLAAGVLFAAGGGMLIAGALRKRTDPMEER